MGQATPGSSGASLNLKLQADILNHRHRLMRACFSWGNSACKGPWLRKVGTPSARPPRPPHPRHVKAWLKHAWGRVFPATAEKSWGLGPAV